MHPLFIKIFTIRHVYGYVTMDVGLLQSALSPSQKQNVCRQKYILFTCELPVVNTVI